MKSVNKIKEYINELNDYLKTYQADHEAWLELSEAYLNELEYAKAAFCLEELILMYPHNHVYYQRYADVSFLIYIYSFFGLKFMFFRFNFFLDFIVKIS